jgi:hypothetical protein
MMRPDSVLHRIAVAKWSPDEALRHLQTTFDIAARQLPGPDATAPAGCRALMGVVV